MRQLPSLPRFVRALASDLLDLLAPPECTACSALFPSHGPLCAPCAATLCPPEDPPAEITAAYAHGGALARAIHRAKYGADPHLARRLGALLAPAVGPLERALVVPVPLHRARLRTRGFNQSAELARALDAALAVDALVRVRDTPAQVGLGRAARLANVRGAFAPRSSRALAGRAVLLLDDVVTTGATLTAARDAALAGGARSVRCIALACAPP